MCVELVFLGRTCLIEGCAMPVCVCVCKRAWVCCRESWDWGVLFVRIKTWARFVSV